MIHEAREFPHVVDALGVTLGIVILLHLVVGAEPTSHRGEELGSVVQVSDHEERTCHRVHTM